MKFNKKPIFFICVVAFSGSALSDNSLLLKSTEKNSLENNKITSVVRGLYELVDEEGSNNDIDSAIKNMDLLLNKRESVKISPALGEYAVIVKNILPLLCEMTSEASDIKKPPYFVNGVELKENISSAINSDLREIDSAKKLEVDDSIILIMMASKMACLSRKLSLKPPNEIFEKQGIPTESLNAVNFDNPDDESLKTIAKQLGISVTQWKSEQEKIKKDLSEKGYTDVDNSEIVNLDESYVKYEKYLSKDILQAKGKLSFDPSNPIQSSDFKFLGAEPSGVSTDRGFSDLAIIYQTPYGKIQINESDLTTSQGTTFVPEEAFNAQIGIYKAAIVVNKGKDVDKNGNAVFEASIYWNNSVKKRDYNVILNKNINDPVMKKDKESLLSELSKAYGL